MSNLGANWRLHVSWPISLRAIRQRRARSQSICRPCLLCFTKRPMGQSGTKLCGPSGIFWGTMRTTENNAVVWTPSRWSCPPRKKTMILKPETMPYGPCPTYAKSKGWPCRPKKMFCKTFYQYSLKMRLRHSCTLLLLILFQSAMYIVLIMIFIVRSLAGEHWEGALSIIFCPLL